MNSKLLLADKKPISQLLVLLAFVFVSVALFAILSMVASVYIYDIDIMSATAFNNFNDKKVVAALKFMQFWQALGLFVIPPIAWSYLVADDKLQLLGIKKKPSLLFIVLIAFLILVAQPLINFLAVLNQEIELPSFLAGLEAWMKQSELKAAEITAAFLKMDSIFDLSVNILIIALLPAIGEELLFRGALQPLLIKTAKNKHLGIWLGAILFSAMHMQFYGFFPRMILGACFGYIFYWTGNLWLPIIGHFVNNGMAVVFAYLIGKQKIDAEVETIGNDNLLFVVISAVVVASIGFVFYKKHKNNKQDFISAED